MKVTQAECILCGAPITPGPGLAGAMCDNAQACNARAAALAGLDPDAEQVLGCPRCGHEWPAEDGPPCPQCGG